MPDELQCCEGTYVRRPSGWHYHWGEPVPGAADLTLADLLEVDVHLDAGATIDQFRPLSPAERRWLTGDRGALDEVLVRVGAGRAPRPGDLVVGMLAPELHIMLMLTVGDIATLAEVSKATVDSYRYRGYLPPAQVTRGRTPLWSRPVIARWLATRPGSGWRSDLYRAETTGAPAAAARPDEAATGETEVSTT